MPEWREILRLNEAREVVEGSFSDLAAVVKQGAGVKVYTTFDYAEHMSVPGSKEGLVQEMMSFAVVYLLEDSRVAAIQTTRYPANCSLGFGEMQSLSFFLNNDSGRNGIARPYLAGTRHRSKTGKQDGKRVGKYETLDAWDSDSVSPCENFTYDFGECRWWVDDSWQERLSVDEDGNIISGSLQHLQDACRRGRTLKVGVRNLCADLAPEGKSSIDHEVFVELHSVYNHQESGFLGGESQPIVRVAPDVPLRYESGNWNFGWILPRTDGIVHQLIIDPYDRSFTRTEGRFATRWFAG